MEDHGNSKSGLFDEELLERVCQLRHLNSILSAVCVAQPGNLADAVSEMPPKELKVQVTVLIGQHCLLVSPDAEHLADLLLEGHAAEQIGDTTFDLEVRILVVGDVFSYSLATQQLIAHTRRVKVMCDRHTEAKDREVTPGLLEWFKSIEPFQYYQAFFKKAREKCMEGKKNVKGNRDGPGMTFARDYGLAAGKCRSGIGRGTTCPGPASPCRRSPGGLSTISTTISWRMSDPPPQADKGRCPWPGPLHRRRPRIALVRRTKTEKPFAYPTSRPP